MRGMPHCWGMAMLRPATVRWSQEENRAIRPRARPPIAWVRPRRSRAGQEGGVAGNSGGTGGSSLPGGGPVALGGGDTGLGLRREARVPRDQCHHWVQFVTVLYGRRGFNPLNLAPKDARQRSGRGRLGAGLGCYRWDRGGLGRKAERIDRGEQLSAPGVLLPQLLGLLP